ncbi:sodium-dependent nutrient amino acid transporter 1 [Folsomia candida]|uniref:Sodium-dependent nutrient amino acid transporter 1 n=1 Tax=Folsomia candida TaxID=158441 RepID=A0A226EQA7_FOLCA|nr:sodium-dependent nutrient amino acid transporter 1 [Folsomia candida]OXA59234.1 Sodium-dependent nutrient amino acid transporter 1 [Folsomia candida]
MASNDMEMKAGGVDNRAFDPSEDFKDDLERKKSQTNSSTVVPSAPENSPDDPDDTVDRMTWDNQWEFLFSCISMSVGLGNVWRFPVTAYENGGGAFIIPYFIVLLFIGRPIYFLELCLGQFASYSQVKVWKCAPIFKGVGFGTMVAALSVLTYYCSILALAVYYFILSFRKDLPWAHCDEDWAGKGNCFNKTTLNPNISSTLPDLFFSKEILREYDNIDDGIGPPDWRLTLCLLFSWCFIFFSIVKGVKSSGKVAYFTALFPYLVLLVLLIRGVTLPGAGDGIEAFFKPDWSKLLEPAVWYAAVTQCFFSLNTGTGSIIMFASYNPFRHNIYRDSIVVSLMDTFTSILAGIITFAILGNLKYELGAESIDDVVQGGTSLAFVAYPDAIAKMDWVPQLLAVLFFMMLFTLGVGSATADAGAIASIFCDRYPNIKRWHVTGAICVFGASVGLIYVTPGGQWMTDLVDFFGGGFVIYVMSTLEVIGVAWCYGLYNFINDMEFMTGKRLSYYWKICWGILIPIFLTVILLYSLIKEGNLTHNDMPYPTIAIVFGWLIATTALITIPIGATFAVLRSKGATITDKIIEATKPKHDWGPRSKKEKRDWIIFKNNADQRTFFQRLRDRSGL